MGLRRCFIGVLAIGMLAFLVPNASAAAPAATPILKLTPAAGPIVRIQGSGFGANASVNIVTLVSKRSSSSTARANSAGSFALNLKLAAGFAGVVNVTASSGIKKTSARVNVGVTAVTAGVGPVAASNGKWISGAFADGNFAGFGAWRGLPVQAFRYGSCRDTWEQMSAADCGQLTEHKNDGLPIAGLAMLPAQGATLAQCATGAYDQYFKKAGADFIKKGKPAAVVTLGWETNGDWYPGSFGVANGDPSAKTIADYKACWRHEALALKSANPQLRMSWNMNVTSSLKNVSVVSAYPGDDVVNEIAVDSYDGDGIVTTAAVFNKECNETLAGGPNGLCSWLAFAKQHNKKLGVPEWGLWSTDDPSYIDQMYNFFSKNSAYLAYEVYFNGPQDDGKGSHLIYPATDNPKSSAEYRKLWSALAK